MKLKRILIIMLCLLITGCKANETEANDKLDMQYKKYTQKLIEQREFSDGSDEFSIRLVLNKINDKKAELEEKERIKLENMKKEIEIELLTGGI